MPPTLLTLPLELREQIFTYVFTFTITHSNAPPSSPTSQNPLQPSPTPSNRTSLLLTSFQLSHEASTLLASSCTLLFPSTESLLTTLLPLPARTLSRLREIHVTAYPFPLYTNRGMKYYKTYSFTHALSLLPGLQLRKLVIDDGVGVEGVEAEVESLVKSGGWGELEFATTGFREFAKIGVWDREIKERNGATSGASVAAITEENGAVVRILATKGKRADIAVVGGEEGIGEVEDRGSWAQIKEKGMFPEDWELYFYDRLERNAWMYGGWSKRMRLAVKALK